MYKEFVDLHYISKSIQFNQLSMRASVRACSPVVTVRQVAEQLVLDGRPRVLLDVGGNDIVQAQHVLELCTTEAREEHTSVIS